MSRNRIEMRVDPAIRALLGDAAAIMEYSLTDFILDAAVKRAIDVNVAKALSERGLEVLGDQGLAGVGVEGDGDGDEGTDVGLAVPTLPSPGTVTDVTDRCVS